MKTFILSIGLVVATVTVLANTQTKNTDDKPWRVYQASDKQKLDSNTHEWCSLADDDNDDEFWGADESYDSLVMHHYDHNWTDANGGQGSKKDAYVMGYYFNAHVYSSTNSGIMVWTNGDSGTEIDTSYQGVVTTNSIGRPVIGDEHCRVSDPKNPPPTVYGQEDGGDILTVTHTETYERTADTVWRVQTGGRAIPGRRNLWQFTGSAKAILDKRATPPFFTNAMREITDKTQIVLKDLGGLKSDGNLWLTLPDCVEKEITPTLAGNDFYTFNVSGQKYPFFIGLTTATTNANLDTDVPEVCVGQQVTFALSGLPLGSISNMVGHWGLPTKYVNEQWQLTRNNFGITVPYGSVNYRINSSLLENTNQTSCWYVNGNGGHVTCNLNLLFPNGQYVSVAANGDFTVYRPTATLEPLSADWQHHYYTTNDDIGITCKLKLGDDDDSGTGTMRFYVDCWSKYSGQFGLTQLITANYSNPLFIFSDERCDGQEYYSGPTGINPKSYTNSVTGKLIPNASLSLDDGPNSIWTTPNIVSLSARDFARFQPDGGIPVTLGIVTWETVGVVEQDFWGNWTKTIDSTTGPDGPDRSDEFPVWTKNQGGMH